MNSDMELLAMRGISKSFPGVKALDNVGLTVRSGTVHGLMGENGAGKSTLMKCLIGLYQPDEGEIVFKGAPIRIANPSVALKSGLSMIHQELSPVAERSVMENIWLGRFPRKTHWGSLSLVDHKAMFDRTREILDDLGLELDPEELVGNLTVAQTQMVEIAKAVSYNAELIIMDEPTSSLTENEINRLFRIIRRLKEQGVGIIYISHKMNEIFTICDEVTVMRDGKYVGTKAIAELTIESLIRMMVGRELTSMFPKSVAQIGEPLLRVENLGSGKAFGGVSFELRRGEILGLAGLMGAGRTELMEALFGIRPITEGRIFIDDHEVHIKSPRDAKEHGMAFLTEDRRKNGIFGVESITDNTIIAHLKAYRHSKLLPFLDHLRIYRDTQTYNERLHTKTPNYKTPIQNLSGGNQQKVLVARWLLTAPEILILDEPTRGIDVGAKAEIHTIVSGLAVEGKSILMVSSELPEVMGMSDRILVMHAGRQTAILDRKDFSQELIMKYATLAPEENGVSVPA